MMVGCLNRSETRKSVKLHFWRCIMRARLSRMSGQAFSVAHQKCRYALKLRAAVCSGFDLWSTEFVVAELLALPRLKTRESISKFGYKFDKTFGLKLSTLGTRIFRRFCSQQSFPKAKTSLQFQSCDRLKCALSSALGQSAPNDQQKVGQTWRSTGLGGSGSTRSGINCELLVAS